MSYPMTEEDRLIQKAAREFVDELIPHEVAAEMIAGELPPDVVARHRHPRTRPGRPPGSRTPRWHRQTA